MTGATLSAAQAESLARGITGHRLAVAAVYDEIARRAGPDQRDFKTVALGIDDPVEAFRQALLSAAGATSPWLHAFLAGLASLGMIDLDAAMKEGSTAENPILILPQNGDATVTEAQAMSEATSGTLKMADLLHAFNLAARRLCLIRAGTKQGTGFLIGPNTVLTNWHVMADLIDAAGKAKPGSSKDITISFETLADNQGRTCLAAEDWMVAFSPMQKDAAVAEPAADCLDFCAVRLMRAPGRERGWYDLSQTGQLDDKKDAFFVFHHPGAWPQRAGFAPNAGLDTDERFLRHMVGTASGSSGGLCLDNRLRPIGLHHAAIWHAIEKDEKGKPKLLYNRAVQLSAINAAHPTLGAADPKYDRISRLSDGSQAVIGRDSTQATLRMMAAGLDPKILVIRGNRLSGKSFSTALLRDSIPIDSRRIVPLSAGELPAEATDVAKLILRRVGVPEVDIEVALTAVASLTTASASVADIFAILKKMLLSVAGANPAQPLTLWLVIDELDHAELPKIGARTLLDQIYNDAELLKVMRVVLIGLTQTLTSVDPRIIATEQLTDPRRLQAEDVEECLAGLMIASGLVPNVGETRRHAALILGATDALDAQGGQSSPLAVLSGLISSVYMKAVLQW